MKGFISTLAVIMLCIITVYGQAPMSFKYQTVLRDSDGNVIANQEVSMTLEILRGSAFGPVVCSETYTPVTNEFGLVNLEVGSQDASGFNAIDWAVGPYFLKITVDGIVMGTSELLSVPYALYAQNSGNQGFWIKQGNNIYYTQGNVGIGSGLINNSAILELTSSTKGFLPTRLTHEQIQAISNPANGLIVFCTDCEADGLGALSMYMYGGWYKFCATCLGPTAPAESTHDTTQTEITWRWNIVTGAMGYKWNTTPDYNTAIDLGTNNFKVETGLACGTDYTRYVWAYSPSCASQPTELNQTTANCIFGNTCPGIPTVEYEGHVYNTVQIGPQCWLRENLDVGVQVDGSLDQLNNGLIEKYCYNNEPTNCEIYGGLYQWEEIMKYTEVEGAQGICPNGWHIPTDGEFCQLVTSLDPTVDCSDIGITGTTTGYKMKSTNLWNDGGNGNNQTGFTGLPGGVRYPTNFNWMGYACDMWTSTLQSNPGAYYWVLGSGTNGIGHYIVNLNWYSGISVRCLKDE